MKDKTDIDALIHFAKNTAKSAGVIIKKYRNSQEYGIQHKATELDLVTEADIETDNFIINQIRKTYPSHQIMTEESYKSGEQFDFKRPLWIIDPIDGTSNFVYGLNDVAVSIGYMEDFEIKAGVIYLPFLDELFWATKGNGAYLGDKRISVRNKPLKTSLVYLGISAKKSKDEVSQYLERTAKLVTRCKSIRNLASSATELVNIANGLVQGKSESNLHGMSLQV